MSPGFAPSFSRLFRRGWAGGLCDAQQPKNGRRHGACFTCFTLTVEAGFHRQPIQRSRFEPTKRASGAATLDLIPS